MTMLSRNFSLAELTVSANAKALGLDNTPPPQVLDRLKITAARMEIVRDMLGDKPIHVSSGYRSAEVNRAAQGHRRQRLGV
ncbi:D-Ala-D-Ala carboxypeptidase family metallohydrolase [Caulobacter sp.]|uniref:D-Ala-D-Ala carboxypeptidase family metallohydrolase n=1 Tax=Caulobacter sp. TaxID=78 RepID=UPI003BAE1E37